MSGVASLRRSSKFDRDTRETACRYRWTPHCVLMRADLHQLSQSLDFPGLNGDPPLPSGPSLKVVDRDRLALEHELSGIRLAKPVVQAGPGYPEPPCRLRRGQ